MSQQPILIWGAGAIGGTLGAAFLRAGENVLFVDNVKEHVDAINASPEHVEETPSHRHLPRSGLIGRGAGSRKCRCANATPEPDFR